jgi:hypothetical protein
MTRRKPSFGVRRARVIAAVRATGLMVIEPVAVAGGPQDAQDFAMESSEIAAAALRASREESKQHAGGRLRGATLES